MRKGLFILLLVVVAFHSYGQQELDSTPLVLNNQVKSNDLPLDLADPLFNGRQHIGYPHTIQGIPYYKVAEWQNGSLQYRGDYYPNVMMKYDLVQDQVIVRHPNGYISVALFTPRVQSFTYLNSHFVYLADSSLHIPAAIYQVVSEGAISFYIRHRKIIDEKVGEYHVEQKFLENDQYYVSKDGRFFPIHKQSEIFNLVKQQRAEIRSYLRSKEVKFRKDPEKAIYLVVDYYNNKLRH